MFERFTQAARHAVRLAQQEARALGHGYLGTEHLLLGLLAEGTGVAARVLAELGVDPETMRSRVVEIIGRGPPTKPDREALRSIGIDIDLVRSKIEEAFGPGALERTWPAKSDRRGSRLGRLIGRRTCRQSQAPGYVPFTPRAKKVLELSLREARQLGHNYLGTEHVLLGLLAEGEGVAATLLEGSGVDFSLARDKVLEELGPSADAG
ncbi:MAG: Clp protease N-terminal domain-containing protein [Nitriliruptorales bacterium]